MYEKGPEIGTAYRMEMGPFWSLFWEPLWKHFCVPGHIDIVLSIYIAIALHNLELQRSLARFCWILVPGKVNPF